MIAIAMPIENVIMNIKKSNELKSTSACWDLAVDIEYALDEPKGYVAFVATNHEGETLHGALSLKGLILFVHDVKLTEQLKK